MRILIGYSMRSGSTLLQHILDQHTLVTAYSDASSIPMLARLAIRFPGPGHLCIKPMDLFFLLKPRVLYQCFDKFIWIARDPRDAYLSAMESKFAYLFWPPGRKEHGIDTGQLRRWRRIYRQYFEQPKRWHLVKYEELVADPDRVLGNLLDYLGLPFEKLFPFEQFKLRRGGDPKLCQTRSIHSKSAARHATVLSVDQQQVFRTYLGEEMAALGYS